MSAKTTSGIMSQGIQKILSSYRNSLFAVTVCALLPYTMWLALAFIALIVLRLNWKKALAVMLPVMIVYTCALVRMMRVEHALITTIITFLPSFMGAWVLRMTQRWNMLALCYLLLIIITAMLVHTFLPELIDLQYKVIETMIHSVSNDEPLFDQLLGESAHISKAIISNLTFGVEIAGLVMSSMCSLFIARAMQSMLINRGGFKQELMNLRGDKLSMILALAIIIAAYTGNILAVNLLPIILLYFMVAGLSLLLHIFSQRHVFSIFCFFVIPMLIVPFIIIPMYIIMGALDCVVNFRTSKLLFYRGN